MLTSNYHELTHDFIVFSKAGDVLLFELEGMSENKINGLSHIYTTWHDYLELGLKQLNDESYCTNVAYSRVRSSTISITVKVRSLLWILTRRFNEDLNT